MGSIAKETIDPLFDQLKDDNSESVDMLELYHYMVALDMQKTSPAFMNLVTEASR